MAQTERRPILVGIIAWLLVGSAIAFASLQLLTHAIAMIAGDLPIGLPLFLLLQVGGAFAVLCVPALALRSGRPWGWFVCAFYFLLIVTGLVAAVVLAPWRALPEEAGLPEWLTVNWLVGIAALVPIVVCGFLYACLMTGDVLDHCKVSRRARWAVVPVQLVLCALLLGWGGYSTWKSVSEQRASLLQRMGDARLSDAASFRYMLERLENGGKEERISAAWALGQSGRADGFAALQKAAQTDPDSDVRMNAVAAMAAIDRPEIEQALLPFLQDDDEQVQAAAVRGLADEKYRESASAVAELLARDSAELRVLAADCLGRMGNGEAVPALIEAADHGEQDVRVHVAFALGRLGDRRAMPVLVGMLADERWEVRANVAQAIGMIGDEAGRRALRELLDDPERQVRYAAQAALDKL